MKREAVAMVRRFNRSVVAAVKLVDATCDIARAINYDLGLDWKDPRTGKVHAAPKRRRSKK